MSLTLLLTKFPFMVGQNCPRLRTCLFIVFTLYVFCLSRNAFLDFTLILYLTSFSILCHLKFTLQLREYSKAKKSKKRERFTFILLCSSCTVSHLLMANDDDQKDYCIWYAYLRLTSSLRDFCFFFFSTINYPNGSARCVLNHVSLFACVSF